MRTFSIRPEREAHALLGISAGGFGAMTIALARKHRDVFGTIATVGRPLNVRYDNYLPAVMATTSTLPPTASGQSTTPK